MNDFLSLMAHVDLEADRDEAYVISRQLERDARWYRNFGDSPVAVQDAEVLEKAAWYCRLTGSAKEMRLFGRTQDAMLTEREAEKVYDSLPDYAQW